MLVLSLFPGIDLLGRGFEAEGFCVVRAPDLIYGQDVRAFHAVPGRFDGVIAGSPCQEFSGLFRGEPPGDGVAMLREFGRVVLEAQPGWFLLENVPRVPDIKIEGYTVQRFDLNARECGCRQSRLRHFQYGSKRGLVVIPERLRPRGEAATICLASEGETTGTVKQRWHYLNASLTIDLSASGTRLSGTSMLWLRPSFWRVIR